MLHQPEATGPLVVRGVIAVDGEKFPALRRALERGSRLVDEGRAKWAQLAELRRTRQDAAADRLVKQILGVKGEPMPEDVKAALRERRAAMTEEEKQAEREERRTNRVLQRLAARATGHSNGTETPKEDDMATKTAKAKKSMEPKVAKRERKVVAKNGERDPRIPAPGSIIKREYKGKSLEVKVLAEGFEFDGEKYTSLSALAKKITGAGSINGLLFFKLTEPKTVEAK
ncbi:MAG TPA: DUF2924 domain-containing protein [Planctomycetota bacterium]|nr:DUF2924 domain-containing protein [Planctomycetota bacterium]